jgi:hypothetical protein
LKLEIRLTIDAGLKKKIQNGKGELFVNATDLLNGLVIKKEILGKGFRSTRTDYYETQVVRVGYNYKF